jgi:hypothetical protein
MQHVDSKSVCYEISKALRITGGLTPIEIPSSIGYWWNKFRFPGILWGIVL